jgi:hypothetical protein
MTIELVFKKEGILVRTKVSNPLTKKESWHEEMVPYTSLPPNFNMLGIRQITSAGTGPDHQIKFIVESFSSDKITRISNELRKGTRIERIASFLLARRNQFYTSRELQTELKEKDLPNLQYEASRLVKKGVGFTKTKKNGYDAYGYTG